MNAAWSRFRSMLRRLYAADSAERRLDDEVQAYLQQDIDARMAAGMTPEEARHTALLELGGVEQVKEHMRTGRYGSWLDSLLQDVRYASRTLAASPGFSLAVIGSLGIGIAANAATFSFINAAVFRPFPGVHAQDELVRLGVSLPVSAAGGVDVASSYDEYLALADGVSGLSALSAHYEVDTFAVSIDGEPSVVAGALVSGNYFDVLGVQPAAGRFFASDEGDPAAGSQPVAVIGYEFWQRNFAADPGAIGRTIDVNGVLLHIVGVAPENFFGVRKGGYDSQLWAPLGLAEIALHTPEGHAVGIRAAGSLRFDHIGRRNPGVTIEQIRVQADAVAERIAAGRGDQVENTTIITAAVMLNDPAENRAAIVSLMALAGIVLAVACINAANLLLARASRRASEWTLRLALGATRLRLTRQLLTESALLALAATAAGLLLTHWVLRALAGVFPIPIAIDANVLIFALVAMLASVLLFGLGPAWSAAATPARAPVAPRASAGPFASKLRLTLIAVQAAFSVGLLATGWQFVRTVQAGAPSGVTEPERLVVAWFNIDAVRYPATAADEFYAQLLERAARLPGVRAAGISRNRYLGSLDQGSFNMIALLDGASSSNTTRAVSVYAGGELMSMLGVEVTQGRGFSPEDSVGRPRSVLVNPAFAEQVLGGQPVGRALRIAATAEDATAVDVTVIGVAAAPPETRTDSATLLYYPTPLDYQPARYLHLRLDRPADDVVPALREMVRQLDARLPILDIQTAQDIFASRNEEDRWLAHFVGAMGLLALALASAGLYGVASYMAALRRREIGIRMTLGGSSGSILRMILRQSLTPAAVGCALGIAGAAAAGMIVRAELYGAAPVDPVAFIGAAALVLAVMLLASLIPAYTASRVEPISVLREE